MIGTLVSVVVAIFMLLQNIEIPPEANLTAYAAGVLIMGAIGGALIALLYMNIWGALQRAELKVTPRVTELFHSDKLLMYGRIWGVLFPLFSFFIATDLALWGTFSKTILLAVMVVLIGITMDMIYLSIKRMGDYLSPTVALSYFNSAARHCVQDERYGDFCAWIDATSEVGVRAVQGIRLSLCMQVLDDLHEMIRHFLQASKSISHRVPSLPEGNKGGMDTVSYILLFAFQRFELINVKAAEAKLEPICSHIVNVLGKIALDAAQYDITLAQYPLLYLGKCTRVACDLGITEVASKAACSLIELAKAVAAKIDLTYLEIAPFYISITALMDEDTKILFREDKTQNFKVLLQPFYDLRALFETEKLASHQDTPAIKSAIEGVLTQFEAVEGVMASMVPYKTGQAQEVNDEGLSTKIIDDLEQRLKANPSSASTAGEAP